MQVLRKHNLIHLPVETKNGQALGRIEDFEFDPASQQILRYHVKSGQLVAKLLQKELLISSEQVISITAEKMVVEDLNIPDPETSVAPASSA